LDHVHAHCSNLFLHVASFLCRGLVVPDKALSLHAKAVSCFNKGKIEPLIGHATQGGQLGQSRMKTDDTTLAAGYAAIGGFNLRQLIHHLLGKDIKPMG
jgi:transposase, IS5 family